MEFTEFGNKSGKTLMLLPGTACKWQFNFKYVLDELAKKHHIIAVNYDGFEGDNTKIFPDMLTVTEKIENYILKNYGGKIVAGLLTMIVGPMFSGACKSEKKREKLKAKLQKKGAVGDGDKSLEFANDFIDNMQTIHPNHHPAVLFRLHHAAGRWHCRGRYHRAYHLRKANG